MILVAVAISFALSALILAKIAKDSSFTESTHPSDPIAMLSASD